MLSDIDDNLNVASADAMRLTPIYLFADSRLLFKKQPDGRFFLDQVLRNTGVKHPSIAYLGASNGDSLSPYNHLFLPAFETTDAGERRMIPSHPTSKEKAFLEQADVVLLAGGSVEVGWRAFVENGLQPIIVEQYLAGAMILGVSAGAVQIGRGGLTDDGSGFLPTFGFISAFIGVNEEQANWRSLRRVVSLQDPPVHAIGIPSGGGVMYHADELFPIDKPVFEIQASWTGSYEAHLYPNHDATTRGPKPS